MFSLKSPFQVSSTYEIQMKQLLQSHANSRVRSSITYVTEVSSVGV